MNLLAFSQSPLSSLSIYHASSWRSLIFLLLGFHYQSCIIGLDAWICVSTAVKRAQLKFWQFRVKNLLLFVKDRLTKEMVFVEKRAGLRKSCLCKISHGKSRLSWVKIGLTAVSCDLTSRRDCMVEGYFTILWPAIIDLQYGMKYPRMHLSESRPHNPCSLLVPWQINHEIPACVCKSMHLADNFPPNCFLPLEFVFFRQNFPTSLHHFLFILRGWCKTESALTLAAPGFNKSQQLNF